MRLIRYRGEEGECYGALMKNTVVCLPRAKRLNKKLPERLEELIARDAKEVEKTEKVIEEAKENEIKRASLLVREVTLLAPIAFPPKLSV